MSVKMSQLLIRISLFLLTIHINNGHSLPKFQLNHPSRLEYKDKEGGELKISNPEKEILREITFYHIVEKPYYAQGEVTNSGGTTESEEYFPIDKRAEKKNKNATSHDESKIHFGRVKRAVTFLDEPDSTQKDEQSDKQKKNLTERFKRTYYRAILDDEVDCDDDIVNTIPVIYDDISVELLDSNSNEELDGEHPEIYYLEYDKSEENDKTPSENAEISIEKENDTVNDADKDSKPSEPSEDDKNDKNTKENTNNSYAIDDVLDKIYKITAGQSSTTEVVPTTIDNTESSNFNTLIHDIFQSHDEPIDGPNNTDPNKSPYINILKGIFTNIVKDNVFINSNIPYITDPDITDPIGIIAAKDKTDDREKPAQSSHMPVSDTNLKDYETTTEKHQDYFTPASTTPSDIEYNKNKDFTSSKSNTDQNSTSFDEINSHKSTTTEKIIQDVPTTHPKETESSTKGNEEPITATPVPVKDDDPSNKKTDSADVNKKIDSMLDLVNNDQFWKFLGDFGGKYLESLIARTNTLIKEEITNQLKEHLNAIKKQEKPVLEKEKDVVKEDKPKIENKTEPISEKHNDTTANSKEKSSDDKENTDTVPIHNHSTTENTSDNNKVTNVYVFYPSDNIDEIIKYIHQFSSKNNGTNLYNFGSSQHKLEKDQDSKNPNHSNELSTDGDQAHNNNIYTTENTIKSTSVNTERTVELTTSTVALIPEKEVITESVNKQSTTEKATTKVTTTVSSPTTEPPHSNPTTESAATKVYTNPTTEPAYTSIGTTKSDERITPALEKIMQTTTEKGPFTIESIATKDETNLTTEPPHTSKPITEATTEKGPFTTESVATKDETVIKDSNPTTEPSNTSIGTTILSVEKNPVPEPTTAKDVSKDTVTESNTSTTESVTTKDIKDKNGTDVTKVVLNYTSPTTESSFTSIGTTISGVEKIPESTTVKDLSKDTTTESSTFTTESKKDTDGIDNVTQATNGTSPTTEPASIPIDTRSKER